MSDFYQILKREIEPIDQTLPSSKKEDDIIVEKKPVDNLEKSSFATASEDKSLLIKVKKEKSSFTKIKKGKSLFTKATKSKSSFTKTKKNKSSFAKATKDKSSSGFLTLDAANPIWLTMAEAAKLGGIQKRTIKRAIRAKAVKFRIIESRYQVDLHSALLYFFSKRKLWNKLLEFGIGQYVEEWKK